MSCHFSILFFPYTFFFSCLKLKVNIILEDFFKKILVIRCMVYFSSNAEVHKKQEMSLSGFFFSSFNTCVEAIFLLQHSLKDLNLNIKSMSQS